MVKSVCLAIVRENVAISKCLSMPEWHTVEISDGEIYSGVELTS